MRGVENGFSLFRPAENGLSIASDPLGRVLARLGPYGVGDTAFVSSVPISGVRTIYPIIGDVFSYACVLLALGLGVAALRGHRRQRL